VSAVLATVADCAMAFKLGQGTNEPRCGAQLPWRPARRTSRSSSAVSNGGAAGGHVRGGEGRQLRRPRLRPTVTPSATSSVCESPLLCLPQSRPSLLFVWDLIVILRCGDDAGTRVAVGYQVEIQDDFVGCYLHRSKFLHISGLQYSTLDIGLCVKHLVAIYRSRNFST
jgi:hypothetical protein